MRGPKVTMVLKEVSTTDTGTGPVETWTSKVNVRGVLHGIRGNERFGPDKDVVIRTHRFFCDYLYKETITEQKRLTWNSRDFDVILVDDVGEQNRYLVVDLKEIKK